MCRKKGPLEDNGIKFFIHLSRQRPGKLPEWSNGPHSKCGERVTVPGVRIPRFPLKRETVVGYKLVTVFFQMYKDYRIDISFMISMFFQFVWPPLKLEAFYPVCFSNLLNLQ